MFIVDEVQTGMALTGKMWAHDHWGLEESPDIVIFAKKMVAAGFYYKPHLIPEQVNKHRFCYRLCFLVQDIDRGYIYLPIIKMAVCVHVYIKRCLQVEATVRPPCLIQREVR